MGAVRLNNRCLEWNQGWSLLGVCVLVSKCWMIRPLHTGVLLVVTPVVTVEVGGCRTSTVLLQTLSWAVAVLPSEGARSFNAALVCKQRGAWFFCGDSSVFLALFLFKKLIWNVNLKLCIGTSISRPFIRSVTLPVAVFHHHCSIMRFCWYWLDSQSRVHSVASFGFFPGFFAPVPCPALRVLADSLGSESAETNRFLDFSWFGPSALIAVAKNVLVVWRRSRSCCGPWGSRGRFGVMGLGAQPCAEGGDNPCAVLASSVSLSVKILFMKPHLW